MKIQIDFDNKIITLENNVNLKEFYDRIKMLLPDGEWKNYNIDTNTVINNWKDPIYIPYTPIPINPYHWWNEPFVWCGTINSPLGINTFTSTGTAIMNFDIS